MSSRYNNRGYDPAGARAFQGDVAARLKGYSEFVRSALEVGPPQIPLPLSVKNAPPGSIRARNLNAMNRRTIKAANRVLLRIVLGALYQRTFSENSEDFKHLRKQVWEASLKSNLLDDPLLARNWWQWPLRAVTLLPPVEHRTPDGTKYSLQFEVKGEHPHKNRFRNPELVAGFYKVELCFAGGGSYREGAIAFRLSESAAMKLLSEGRQKPFRRQIRLQEKMKLQPRSQYTRFPKPR